MSRKPKTTEEQWYDVFDRWTLADQQVAVKVLDRLVKQRDKDEHKKSAPPQETKQ